MSNQNATFGELLAKKKPLLTDEANELPVRGGRQTTPDGTSTLGGILAELSMITPDFNIQLLGALETLAIYNAEVSYGVDNIKQLGNTTKGFPTNITFDDNVSESQIKDMITLLKIKSKKWCKGGINSLINNLFSQIAINGALSAEMIPDNGLQGISKVALVAPKTIKFKYEDEDYRPYQHVTRLGVNNINGVKLNEVTYKYIPLHNISEKPYGIPPFISALENIQISRDMADNMKAVVKKLGILGFLQVLVNGPKKNNGENADSYYNRTKKYLNQIVPEVEKGMAKGYVVGIKDSHEFNMQPTTGNVQGAKDLIEINDVKLMAGLKQDPLMFGRNFSTTETLGRVILAKMTTQVVNYQQIIQTFLEQLFLTELQLAGFKIKNVEIWFDPPMIGDTVKEEEARAKKIENLKSEYQQGIISQEVVAQELGREKPHLPEPIAPAPPLLPVDKDGNNIVPGANKEDVTKTKDDKKTKTGNTKLLPWQLSMVEGFKSSTDGLTIVDVYFGDDDLRENVVILNGEFLDTFDASEVVSIIELSNVGIHDVTQRYINSLGGHLEEYPYSSEGCNCEAHSDTKSFQSGTNGDELNKFINDYFDETAIRYDKATRLAVKEIGENLAKLGAGATQGRVYDVIMYTLYKNWGENFTAPQKKTINKFIKNVYTFFRKDSSIFKGASDIPKGTFGTLDLRAIEYYKRADSLYLGKFITDEDLKRKVTQYLKDEYLDGDLPIGTNKKALAKFRAEFGEDILKGQEWKLTRVISTTVNKMRNTAAVNYMQQAQVEQYEIVGIKDSLQCAYCAALQGAKFSVKKSVDQISQQMQSDPQFVGIDSPFINSVFKKAEDMEGLTSDELQDKGIGLPPFHAHCRDQAVAIL